MDELNLRDNLDIYSRNRTIAQIFSDDYWGSDMQAPNSNKSWRPLSVLLFRYLQPPFQYSEELPEERRHLVGVKDPFGSERAATLILWMRFVNVLIHTVLSEVISITAVKLFTMKNKTKYYNIVLRTVVKLLFGLHPSHPEVAANGANRPHELCLLFTFLAINVGVNSSITSAATVVGVFGLLSMSLLSCETALFQVPALILSILVVYYNRTMMASPDNNNDNNNNIGTFIEVVKTQMSKIIAISIATAIYLAIRFTYNMNGINPMMIKKTENAFFDFVGMKRVYSFMFVTAIHVFKACGIELIGSAHEYGFDCIAPVESMSDVRLIYPVGIIIVIVYGLTVLLKRGRNSFHALLNYLLFLSWIATLFPICGIIKIGTFVSDRLTFASTAGVTLFAGKLAADALDLNIQKKQTTNILRTTTVLLLLAAHFTSRVLYGCNVWSNNFNLMHNGVRVCPRSVKFQVEMVKIYNGLVDGWHHKKDLHLAQKHCEAGLEVGEACEIHWQDAQNTLLRIQDGLAPSTEYAKFELAITKAVMCGWTKMDAWSLYNQYWQVRSQDDPNIMERKKHFDQMIIESEELLRQEEKRYSSKGGLLGGIREGDENLEARNVVY